MDWTAAFRRRVAIGCAKMRRKPAEKAKQLKAA
jgi:hypothetical protein